MGRWDERVDLNRFEKELKKVNMRFFGLMEIWII